MTTEPRMARAVELATTIQNGNLTDSIDKLLNYADMSHADTVVIALHLAELLVESNETKTLHQVVDLLTRLIDTFEARRKS